MQRQDVNNLIAFLAVARAGSFTRAAAMIGVSQSALSHTIRQFESRLGIRLLARTTRSVSPTEAGIRLLERIGPHLDDIEAELEAISALRDKPSGTIRITAGDYPVRVYLWPRLRTFLKEYPDIRVEINADYGLQDIVARRFDAGVRLGEQVEKDMIAVRISPDIRFAVVGAPACFADRPPPATPKDLTRSRCINLHLPTFGGNYVWEFVDGGRDVNVRVDGQLTFNRSHDVLAAALDGFGLAYLPEDLVRPHLATGELVRVLEDFCPSWSGFHLYYPNRRQHAPAFALLVEALRCDP